MASTLSLRPVMHYFSLLSLFAAGLLASAKSATAPIVDLGSAGKYLGVVQNNGTVHSWKGNLRLIYIQCD
jgi:uncharacterized membrane protein